MNEKIEQRDMAQQRSRVVRTAWALGIIAAVIFVAFVLSGVLAEPPAA